MKPVTILLVMLYMVANFTVSLVPAQTSITTDQTALLALKSQLTSDPENILTTNWSTTTSVCSWVGITCGVRHLRVTALNLSELGLTGTIPPHLGNLTFLVKLILRNNSFQGTLPQELAGLRRLQMLSFGFNNFMGTIPSWFGSLSKLRSLNLYANQFSGSIPPAIFNLSALQVLNLNKNHLSGSIPGQIGNSTMLKQIELEFNNFKEIPDEIGYLYQLETLRLRGNSIGGLVPVALLNISSLITLDLTANNFSGRIPDNICQHLPSIQSLYLTSNNLDGPLPSTLGQCRELLFLSFALNHFSGSIPTSIGTLTQLLGLNLGDNQLTGTIPNEIGNLLNLQYLSLQLNNIAGTIPVTFSNLSEIIRMSLAVNQLSGSLPANMGLLFPNLEEFTVGGNNFSGQIPSFVSNVSSKLTKLDMAENSFSGFIPSSLCALKNLDWLALGQNNLTIDTSTPEANMLSCLPDLRNLRIFSFQLSPLYTVLPLSMGNLSPSLEELFLGYCNLRGSIPNDIANLTNLSILELSGNQLYGSIPKTIGRLQNLQGLYLNYNELQGDIPSELCQLDDLVELILEQNQLSGSIPACLGNLSRSLRRLSFFSNLLTSTIPSTLWGLQNILMLDLSSNILNGSLSGDIGNMKVVRTLDFSDNHFSGNLPSSLGDLKDLVSLSLQKNNFEGLIPITFGTLVSLELLDISKNNLSGVIPKSLEALLHLEYLNLSFNKLQGEIPTGGPFKNFSAASFVSNGELCGESRLQLPACEASKQLQPKSRKSGLKFIIAGTISAVFLVVFASVLILRRNRKVAVASDSTLLPQLVLRRVSQLELKRATSGFSEINLLGTGGFGSVYKGTLSDGVDVAVKVFNLQLEGAFKSFDSECQVLSNIRHRNLIKIISCVSELDFKALVLQYMPNRSLDDWLYSQNIQLNILQRLNIMVDAASALEYLHHGHGYSEHIVHCDVKPSNILLDADMVGHVADFGISNLLGVGDSMTQTMTLATIGYMAPEFGMEGIVSTRGDVYSFGIVLMETFTKRRPTDEVFGGEMNLKQWVANSLLPDATIVEVVDADLLGTEEDPDFGIRMDCVSSIMRLALSCAAEPAQERINMQDAVVTLKKIKIKFLKDCEGVQT